MTIEKFSSDFLEAEAVVVTKPAGERSFLLCKRGLDLGLALMLIPGLALCWVILVVLNPFMNRGAILYTQERVGLYGRRFNIYKFRTMMGDNESEPRFATEECDRINRLGAFMRRTRIDELPQILNVLRGDMSMIGPRPEQVEFYSIYESTIPGYARRQTVRPGISGLAQLKYGYTDSVVGAARKLKWDLEYISRMGFRIEMYIVWNTFRFVMGRLLRIRMKTKL